MDARLRREDLAPRLGANDEPSRMGRNIRMLAGSQIATWSMALLWTLVVPRALGPGGMGLIVSAWSVTGILAILLGLGTRNFLVRAMVVDRGVRGGLVGTAVVLRLALTPLFVAGLVAYGAFAESGREGTLVLYLAGAATILTLLAEPMQAAFQAIERMEYIAYSDVLNKSAQGLLGVALALLGFRAVGITASWIVVAAIVVVLNVIWLRRYMRIELRTTYRRLVEMVRSSIAYWAFGLFFVIYLWIDAVMLSLMTRPEVVGWYGVPTKLFQSLLFLPVVVSTAWLPRLVSAYEDGAARFREEAGAPLERVLVLSLPIAAGTVILAGPVIHVLYGPAYDHAVPVLVILGLCIPPMYLNIMLNQTLVAAGRQKSWAWVMAGATVVNPLLNLALIKATESRYENGAIGAAISLLLTEVLIVAAGLLMVGRHVLAATALRRFLVAAVVAGAACAVAYGTHRFGERASASAGILVLGLLTVTAVVKPGERALVRTGLRDLLARPRPERQEPDVVPVVVPPQISLAGSALPGVGEYAELELLELEVLMKLEERKERTEPEERTEPGERMEPEAPAPVAAESFLLFGPGPQGYWFVDCVGRPPEVGASLQINGSRLLVLKLGPSPLPGDPRICAHLVGE